jgi:hypothetical protein
MRRWLDGWMERSLKNAMMIDGNEPMVIGLGGWMRRLAVDGRSDDDAISD